VLNCFFNMNLDFFKKVRILDGGMGQELLSRGLVSYGSLWSASALIDEKNHNLVVDTHSAFIEAGADVIVTNTFSSRKVRLEENKVLQMFDYANKKAGELATKARDNSKKDILIAGGLPPQNGTYVVDNRDRKIIEQSFDDQAKLIDPYIDFFYLDVFSSSWEIELALNVVERLNKPVLVGFHLKKDGKLPSNETVSEIVKNYKSNNWLGLIASCVSLEIIENNIYEFKKLGLPFGFKANLWGKEEPLPVSTFNKSKPDEIGQNPNISLGSRKEVTGEVFHDFAKKLKDKGATILGGCCETNTLHISAISKLK
tara:strand:- start:353 stop:1291 length:939 start_codon:yes stop_codon:yes gene_type:complete